MAERPSLKLNTIEGQLNRLRNSPQSQSGNYQSLDEELLNISDTQQTQPQQMNTTIGAWNQINKQKQTELQTQENDFENIEQEELSQMNTQRKKRKKSRIELFKRKISLHSEMLLRWMWSNVIPTMGLSFIYIWIHMIGKYLIGVKYLSRFGVLARTDADTFNDIVKVEQGKDVKEFRSFPFEALELIVSFMLFISILLLFILILSVIVAMISILVKIFGVSIWEAIWNTFKIILSWANEFLPIFKEILTKK